MTLKTDPAANFLCIVQSFIQSVVALVASYIMQNNIKHASKNDS